MKERILVIDDDADQCELLKTALDRIGYEAITAGTSEEGIDKAAREPWHAILTDLGMGGVGGVEMCERLTSARPDVPVIVVTGFGNLETAIAAMRSGAYDFLAKPVDVKLLGLSVARAVKHRNLQSEVQRLREGAGDRDTQSSTMVGGSRSMKRVSELVSRVAASDASVLISGETGTGKELIARAIHAASTRKDGPFVAINCAAVPATLLESELFGHARGAFTDAKSSRNGLFVQASGGTLFLDEIGEMPLDMQPKLLRALQERVVRPVGSNQEVPFDSRIVAATHRDLEAEAETGRFRHDLFYRINVVRIDVPPLRDRGSDVLSLASHFLEKLCQRSDRAPVKLSTPVAERLLAYDWPGNVRELENCMERAVALARFDQLTLDDLPERIRTHRADRFAPMVDQVDEILTLDELERRYIARVIKLVDGNKSRAAQLLGLDRRTLYRRLERYTRESSQPPAPNGETRLGNGEHRAGAPA